MFTKKNCSPNVFRANLGWPINPEMLTMLVLLFTGTRLCTIFLPNRPIILLRKFDTGKLYNERLLW